MTDTKTTQTDPKVNELDILNEPEKVAPVEESVKNKVVEVKTSEVKKEKNSIKRVSKKVTGTSNELLEKHEHMLQFMNNMLDNMEMDIKRVKLVVKQLMKFNPENPKSLDVNTSEIQKVMGTEGLKSYTEDSIEVVEWKFDGYFMIGSDQKKYPVPLNYSSKTKLVPGDVLKLKIMSDGKFIYKLIQPIERKHLRATLSKTDENKFIAVTDEGQTFFLNQAAVTFFKGKPGDELYVVSNKNMDGGFAAIEAIIKK